MAQRKQSPQQTGATATRVVEQTPKKPYASGQNAYTKRHEPEQEQYEDPRDHIAELLIRWVPAGTALLCAAIAMGGFIYCKLFLG